MINSLTYIIVQISDLPLINFTEVGQTSAETIRKSIDETQFVLKYDTTPSFISDGCVTPDETLNHEGALALMATPEWSEPISEE